MINNICENNKSIKANTTFKATINSASIVDSRHNGNDKLSDVATTNNNNNMCRAGAIQTTYGYGIWHSEIIEGANNENNNAIAQKQQYCNNAIGNNNNNSSTGNVLNKNVWLSTASGDVSKEQQQQSHGADTNNECDIVIFDIENDDDDNEVFERQREHHCLQQQLTYSVPSSNFFTKANIKYPRTQSNICDSERGVEKNNIISSANINTQYPANDCHVNTFDIIDSDNAGTKEDDEDDSLASMETLSDNVSIWIDGEKHWVAGVDANTTCSDLIWALLNYQNAQQSNQRQSIEQRQHTFGTIPLTDEENIATTVINKISCNQSESHELRNQQQQLPKFYEKNVIEFNLRTSTNEGNSNTFIDNKPNIQNTDNTNNIFNDTTITDTITTSINQSMTINTKENYKIIQNTTLAAATKGLIATPSTPIISSLAPVSKTTPPLTLLPLSLPPGIATASQLATEYVIVRQYHHCEEYLDGSTKVFDILPPRNESNKKECELLLRHLGPPPAVYANGTTPQLSSLISTDKDSGMGSPVGSARSAKFRRRKHKSSQWLSQANTLHPKLSHCTANDRLVKIILAQDETIQRQLSLLREKERQITKIEEEKHRKRERELGKNYLLETYLNGLDEAECEPETQHSEEIFIDEPYQRAAATALSSTNTRMEITEVMLDTGAITNKIPSAIETFNMMAKHKLKEKEVKKEKKKKKYKEQPTKDEEIQAKDFNLKTNKNKDKEKEKEDKEQQHYHNESKEIDGNYIEDNGNGQDIERQILWLEKIYTLNKQLQKEEELAAKLHAKVRKHQLRKTQKTQREVQIEIDKLDNNLALQCGDIRKVEANLMQTNEQLQKKLLILERLSMEYLKKQQNNESHCKHDDIRKPTVTINSPKQTGNPLKNDTNILLTNMENSLDIQKLSLNDIKSKEEVIKLEKIIAKPSKDQQPVNAELKSTEQNLNIMTQNVANNPITANKYSVQPNQIFPNVTPNSTNRCSLITIADNQQLHNDQQEITEAPTLAISVSQRNEGSCNDIESTPCMFIDKNMLSSLHIQNAKTIKKQMFHTQTTSAAAASPSTASSEILPPMQTPSTLIAFPKQQFQQTMPMASLFLTSRPQSSHQKQDTNIVIVQQPSIASSSCSAHLAMTKSSPLTLASVPISTLSAQYPANSSSPSPSIMAMNTVDISQLGTLV